MKSKNILTNEYVGLNFQRRQDIWKVVKQIRVKMLEDGEIQTIKPYK